MRRIGFLVLLLSIVSLAGAQVVERDLFDRPYEAAVVSAGNFPLFFGAPISELYLYAYDGATGSWRAVSFQIDERNENGSYFGWNDGLLDQYDELVFLVRDMGDRVPDGYWLDEASSHGYVRYEIALRDTFRNGEVAWVYLFRAPQLQDFDAPAYISYDSSADEVLSTYYRVGFNDNNGLPDEYAILPDGGGSGLDILDRAKFRAKAVAKYLKITKKIVLNEDNIQKVEISEFPNKPVRFIRNMRTKIDVAVSFGSIYTYHQEVDSVYFPIFFYPYNLSILANDINLDISEDVPSGMSVKVTHIRSSQDLSSDAVGMFFYSEFNRTPGAWSLIDGSGGHNVPDDHLVSPGLTWMMVTGNPGTMVTVSTVPTIGTRQRLYYYDDNSYGAAEWEKTPPTGDKKSFGDHGILIDDDAGDHNITGVVSLLSDVFFLPSNQPPDVAEELRQNIEHPLEIEAWPQSFDIWPPIAVNDLTVRTLSDSTVEVSWTAPGDDSTSGRAARYELRYSDAAPDSGNLEAWFQNATPVAGLPAPKTADSLEAWIVTGLRPLTTYYFALRSYDEAGNASPISNIASATSLDVELTTFTASIRGGAVELSWTTASERNNLGFEVQRRRENEAFRTIGFVPGKGTVSGPQNYKFVDQNVSGGRYFYRLKQVDISGQFELHQEIAVDVPVPQSFALYQNYPNPFNPQTTLRYDLAGRTHVRLAVFNVVGQLMAVLVDAEQEAGHYRVTLNASGWPSGLYFVRLVAGNRVFTRKIVLVE